MRALVHDAYGTAPEDVLHLAEVAKPTIDIGQVLASACNERGPGHLAHHGRSAVPEPGLRIWAWKPKYLNPGRRLAGTVEAVGKEASVFEPGDEVSGIGRRLIRRLCKRSNLTQGNLGWRRSLMR